MARKAATKDAKKHRGQIIQRGERKWLIRVYIGRDATGKRKYSSKTINGTYKQAEQALTKNHREIDTGTFVEPSKQRLIEFLTGFSTEQEAKDALKEKQSLKGWLGAKLDIAEKTRADYEFQTVRHILPRLGHLKLDAVTTQKVQEFVADLQRADLSPRTVQYIHRILSQALSQAVGWGLLFKNPCGRGLVTLPQREHNEPDVFSPAQVNLFLEVTKEHPRHALWALLLDAGLRPEEALALKWTDVDGSTVRIVRAMVSDGHGKYTVGDVKTKKSRRSIPLQAETVEKLQSYKSQQAKAILKAGEEYDRQGFIFANGKGNPLDIANVRREWKACVKAARKKDDTIGNVGLYGARHTMATLMLAGGVALKIVSERLGHSSVAITGDIYSHVSPTMQQGAVETLQAVLQAAR